MVSPGLPSSPEASPWLPLGLPWQKALPELPPPTVRFWHQAGRLYWEMNLPLPLAPRESFPANGFLEGLWKQDVAECFIATPALGTYTEYNLSPGGAWWAAQLIGPRLRQDPQPSPERFSVRSESAWEASHWIAGMSVPLPDPDACTLNFTAIVTRPEGRQFYSLAPLGGDRPDFHRPGEWLPLLLGQ